MTFNLIASYLPARKVCRAFHSVYTPKRPLKMEDRVQVLPQLHPFRQADSEQSSGRACRLSFALGFVL